MQNCVISQPVGKTQARSEVVAYVVGDLPARIKNHIGRQRAISRNARRKAAGGAGRRKLLEDVSPIFEVHVAGLNAALLADGGISAIGRDKRIVVAQSGVDCELGRGL